MIFNNILALKLTWYYQYHFLSYIVSDSKITTNKGKQIKKHLDEIDNEPWLVIYHRYIKSEE